MISNGLIVERQVCVTPDHPRGVWRVADVSLADLVEALRAHEDADLSAAVPALSAALEATPEQLSIALDWLRARRMLAEGDVISLPDPA